MIRYATDADPRPCSCTCTCTPTPAQAEVIAHLAEGRSNRQAAIELGVSVRKVEDLSRAARERLGARDRAHLVAIAFRDRLIGFDRDGHVVVAGGAE